MAGEEGATTGYPDFLPIMDWYGTWAGHVGWPELDGPCTQQDIPYGVRLCVQEAESTEPFLKADKPWEMGLLNYHQVMYDEDRYRMWYAAAPDAETIKALGLTGAGSGGIPDFACYAESEDGFTWTKPNLGMYEFAGSKDNNIITQCNVLQPDGWQPYMIFRDPSAPPEERYKSNGQGVTWIVDGKPLPQMPKKEALAFVKQAQMEGYPGQFELQFFVIGWTSPDGLHWKRCSEPLMYPGARLDMRNMVLWDEDEGQYVAYLRGHVGRRRTLRKTRSKSFMGGWEPARQILMADSQDEPDLDFYDFGYCKRPGGHYHLMFFGAFHRSTDEIDLHLAVSQDGDYWTRPERKRIVSTDVVGRPGETYVTMWASPGLIELKNDLWGQAFFGRQRAHWDFDVDGWVERPQRIDYCWALWKRDRLVALEAPVRGRVTLLGRKCAGREMLFNFKTERGGYIRAELVSGVGVAQKYESSPIEGFTFEDCDPLYGDSLAAPVSWKGSADLSSLAGRNITVRLEVVKAKVFATSL